jgi:hypothetical protein
MKSGLLGTGLVVLAIALPSTGSAQAPRPCTPEEKAGVQITSRDKVQDGSDNPLYATHEVEFSADVAADARNVQLTPEAGVTVLRPGSHGRNVDLVIPKAPSLTISVSWEQPTTDDPDLATQCSASQTLTFPVRPVKRSTVRQILKHAPRLAQNDVSFEIRVPLRRQNLDPIELTLRRSSHARLPSPRSKAIRWSVPLRVGEQVRYAKKIPDLTIYLSVPKRCRYWYMSCGAVFATVSAINIDGVILHGLPFTQPLRWAARDGISVNVHPGPDLPHARPFGFDIQARQSGRLIARYQRAGICREVRRSSGIFHYCPLTVLKNFPR